MKSEQLYASPQGPVKPRVYMMLSSFTDCAQNNIAIKTAFPGILSSRDGRLSSLIVYHQTGAISCKLKCSISIVSSGVSHLRQARCQEVPSDLLSAMAGVCLSSKDWSISRDLRFCKPSLWQITLLLSRNYWYTVLVEPTADGSRWYSPNREYRAWDPSRLSTSLPFRANTSIIYSEHAYY